MFTPALQDCSSRLSARGLVQRGVLPGSEREAFAERRLESPGLSWSRAHAQLCLICTRTNLDALHRCITPNSYSESRLHLMAQYPVMTPAAQHRRQSIWQLWIGTQRGSVTRGIYAPETSGAKIKVSPSPPCVNYSSFLYRKTRKQPVATSQGSYGPQMR